MPHLLPISIGCLSFIAQSLTKWARTCRSRHLARSSAVSKATGRNRYRERPVSLCSAAAIRRPRHDASAATRSPPNFCLLSIDFQLQMAAHFMRPDGPATTATIVISGYHPSDHVCELAEHAPRLAVLDRERIHDIVQRGAPMVRRGNFTHEVKLLNIVDDMSCGLPSAVENRGRALTPQAL